MVKTRAMPRAHHDTPIPMKNITARIALLSFLVCSTAAFAENLPPGVLKQIDVLRAEKASRTPSQRKLIPSCTCSHAKR